MKNLLTIAGSDCSGGAGIQADLKTFAAHGTFGMSVIVSIVAENTERVISICDMAPSTVADQIDAVFEDIAVDGVKIGMLSGTELMRIVARKLKQYRPRGVVVDPVMLAKGGCALMQPEALRTLKEEILPLACVLTPNIPEAEAITGRNIITPEDRRAAAKLMFQMGAENILLKGGIFPVKRRTCCLTAAGFTPLHTKGSKQKTRTARDARCPPPLRLIWRWA